MDKEVTMYTADGLDILYHSGMISEEEYLAHHGILGQKWGIRRYQNLDGSLTEEGRKKIARDKQAITPGRAGILPKGTRVANVSTMSSYYDRRRYPNAYDKRWLYVYNPDNKNDESIYKGPFGIYTMGRDPVPYKQIVNNILETNKDLKIADSDEAFAAFKELYSKNSEIFTKDILGAQEKLKKHSPEQLPPSRREAATADLRELKSTKEYELGYNLFNMLMENNTELESTKMFSKAMAKNYDGMIDDNNRTVYNHAEAPLIIFDRFNLDYKDEYTKTVALTSAVKQILERVSPNQKSQIDDKTITEYYLDVFDKQKKQGERVVI